VNLPFGTPRLEYVVAMSNATMKAIVFDGPRQVSLQDRPIPQIQAPTDIIVAVSYTALCGSYVCNRHDNDWHRALTAGQGAACVPWPSSKPNGYVPGFTCPSRDLKLRNWHMSPYLSPLDG